MPKTKPATPATIATCMPLCSSAPAAADEVAAALVLAAVTVPVTAALPLFGGSIVPVFALTVVCGVVIEVVGAPELGIDSNDVEVDWQ